MEPAKRRRWIMLLGALGGGALWVVGRMLRSRPARVLLLRKFNNAEVDYRLRRRRRG